MKKILPIIIFIATYNVVYAQDPHTIDTIWNSEPTYFYQYWFDSADCVYQRSKPECGKDIGFGRNTEVAKYNYTDSALTIIGVAAVVCIEKASTFDPNPSEDPGYPPVIIDGWAEQMKLYKPTDTGMVLLASRSYSILDTAHWMRLFLTNAYSHSVVMRYMPVFEAYFDEPVIVTDSFYVATTNHYGGDTLRRTVTCIYRHEPIGLYAPCWPQYYKIGTVYGSGLVWHHEHDSYVWFIFPIIDTVQPVCEVPLGLHVNGQDSTGVHLVWDSAEHNRSWTVAYGRADADPDGYVELPCSTTDFAIADLDPGVIYAARVRAICFDNNTYSEWSDTIRFVREEEVGIDRPDGLRAEVRIRPNPAHSSIAVTADATIKSIEIFDMQGHLLLSRSVYGKRTKIAVGNWPKGSYIVHTNTTLGTNFQKMVVE